MLSIAVTHRVSIHSELKMAEDNNSQNQQTEEYIVTYRNGALVKLKTLANKFGIPEDDLNKVIEKGLKVLELQLDDNRIIFKRGNDTFFVDLNKL